MNKINKLDEKLQINEIIKDQDMKHIISNQ